jgi:predicted dinucleotide-binding enzyme
MPQAVKKLPCVLAPTMRRQGSTVIALAKEIVFEAVDAGQLDALRNNGNLGLLVGHLAYGSGFANRVTLRAYVES